MNLTIISSWALLIAKVIDDSGFDSQEIFKQAGLDPAKLKDPNARFSYENIKKLWAIVAEITGDPCIGLKAASYWHPTSMHALGYSWMASASLKEALQRLVRYLKVVTTVGDLALEENGDEITLVATPRETVTLIDEAIDAGMAVITLMCRTNFGDSFTPSHVYFTRKKPECDDTFSSLFRAPITYSASKNAITFSRKDLEKSLSTANAELAQTNDKIVMEYLATLDKNDIKARVEAKIVEELPSGRITEEWMASRLNQSLRSLQRKLAETGTSYKSLLDSTRQQLAKQYVANSHYSINEITYLLGFSEPSNFSRAFKRWTGQSPSQYRENLYQ